MTQRTLEIVEEKLKEAIKTANDTKVEVSVIIPNFIDAKITPDLKEYKIDYNTKESLLRKPKGNREQLERLITHAESSSSSFFAALKNIMSEITHHVDRKDTVLPELVEASKDIDDLFAVFQIVIDNLKKSVTKMMP